MLDLPATMQALARERPIFHSERDFQFWLGWMLREHCGLRPLIEVPWRLFVPGAHERVDITADTAHGKVAIELKYLTRGIKTDIGGEFYQLSNQSAQDMRRYDILRDIERLEKLTRHGFAAGYMLALSNEPLYWNRTRARRVTNDEEFRLHHGRNISGKMQWGPHTGAGTKFQREAPIFLCGHYTLHWHPYSMIRGTRAGEFRYLLVEIPAVNGEVVKP